MSDESVFALQSMQPTSRVALVGVDCSGYHGPFDLWGSPSTVVVSRGSYSAGVKIRDLIKLDSEEDADEFLRSDHRGLKRLLFGVRPGLAGLCGE